MLTLEPIAESKRRQEKDVDAEFAAVSPLILGALLDGLVAGLANLSTIAMPDKPRMADFALWGEACTRAYWPAGTFLAAYRESLANSVELVLEGNVVASMVRRFMIGKTEWEGHASDLLPLLTDMVGEQAARDKGWPKRPNGLSGKLRRAAPTLRKVGIHVENIRAGHGGQRTVNITARSAGPEQRAKTSSPLPPSSPAESEPSKNNGMAQHGGDGR